MPFIGNQPADAYTSFAKQDFTTSVTTSYTLDYPVANENEIALFINFVRQEPTTAYTASGTSLTLTSATSATDDMYAVFIGKAVQTVNPPAGSVDSSKINYPLTTFSSTGIDDNATSTAITIDSNENVGIGTSGGNKQLTLESSGSNCGIRINNSVTGRPTTIGFDDSNDLTIWNNSTNGNIKFYNQTGSGTERMKIESDGKIRMDSSTLVVDAANNRVGIGTSVPSQKFEVFSQGATAMTSTINATGSGLFVNSQGYSNTMTALSFNTNYGAVGSITCSNTTSYNTTSDYRLKENVSYDFDATSRLKQLKPARFNFIADADTTVDGFLAHEVSSVVPEAIHGTKDAVDENGNPEYQGIDQSKLVPLLVKTIQELEARITTLENA